MSSIAIAPAHRSAGIPAGIAAVLAVVSLAGVVAGATAVAGRPADGPATGPGVAEQQPASSAVRLVSPAGPAASDAPVPAAIDGPRGDDVAGPAAPPVSSDLDRPAGPAWQDLDSAYDLDVRVDLQRRRAAVEERIDIVNRSTASVSTIDLSILAASFGEVDVHDVRVGGASVAGSWTNPANLQIALPRAIGPGERADIELGLEVAPSADISSSQQLRTSDAEGILRFGGWFGVVSDGHGRRFPGDSQVTAAGRYRVDLAIDGDAVVAMPGRQLSAPGGHRIYELDPGRDLAFSVSPTYRRFTRNVDGVTVEAYLVDPAGAARVLDDASAALRTFSAAYGPYPYQRLVIAASPRTRSGNEYPGIVFLGAESLRDRVVIAHEIAHQWFYGLVGSDQIREPWLDEAFAEFSAEHFFGQLAPTCSTRPVDSAIADFPDRRAGPGCDGYDDVVYHRGALFVDAVRQRLGDARFFATMRAFVAAHRFGIVTEDDLTSAWLRADEDPVAITALIGRYLACAGAHEGSCAARRAE